MGRGRRINVLVVYDQSEKSYQWSLSLLGLRILIGAAIVTVLMALVAIVLAWQTASQRSRINELAAENKRLTVYSFEVNQLKEELAYHRSFTRRLCGLVGVEFPDSVFPGSRGVPLAAAATEWTDSTDANFGLQGNEILSVSGAPLPSQLSAHPENRPVGVPMRGRASRGFAPEEENVSLRHFGLDIAGREGLPVFATAAGVVEFVGWDEAMGNTIIIDHGNGFKTIYGHNSVMMCKAGDEVQFGDIICLSGNSGRSSAPHLHYEIRYYDQPVDPLRFIFADTISKSIEDNTLR